MDKDLLQSSGGAMLRHVCSFVAGYILSRLLKHGVVTSDEAAIIIGFLPSLLFTVFMAVRVRILHIKRVRLALGLPEFTTEDELKKKEAAIKEAEKRK
jgi:hypothetical protein